LYNKLEKAIINKWARMPKKQNSRRNLL